MDDLIERCALAIQKSDGMPLAMARVHARAAIDEITKGGSPCGVCGCAVYKGLPTALTPLQPAQNNTHKTDG